MGVLDDAIEFCVQEDPLRYAAWHDEARKELAELRANQLPANVVAAIRAYQEACAAYVDFAMTTLNVDTPDDHPVLVAERRTFKAVYWAIEADAKERG